MLAASQTVTAFAVAFLTFLVYKYATGGQSPPQGTRLPDGPAAKPIVGNLLEIPPKHSWLQFHKWSKQYGSLYRLSLAGKEHYIISTEKVANDLLRERGSTYSSREQMPAAVALLGDNLRPLFWPHNEVFRNGRKLMHHYACPLQRAVTNPSSFSKVPDCSTISSWSLPSTSTG